MHRLQIIDVQLDEGGWGEKREYIWLFHYHTNNFLEGGTSI